MECKPAGRGSLDIYRPSRRDFVKICGTAALGAAAAGTLFPRRAHANLLPGRVVHIRNPNATSWDFSTGHWFDSINQAEVDSMVDVGLTTLTDTSSAAEAWGVLIPSFTSGQTIAIKVNFNNYHGGARGDAIDSVIEPINSLIGGLIAFGFAPADISVYEMTSAWNDGDFPTQFTSGCDYPGVNFVQFVGHPDPFSGTESVTYSPPSGPGISPSAIANVVVDADYVINVPVCKYHPFSGVSLGMKNHYGSIQNCHNTHDYLQEDGGGTPAPYYDPTYSPMVDIHLNTHFRDKTVLILGDCLFGAWNDCCFAPPEPWTVFGSQAADSLFFATDPVSIDCVMADFIRFELDNHTSPTFIPTAYDTFQVASTAGLGTYEKAATLGTYSTIDYRSGTTGIHGWQAY